MTVTVQPVTEALFDDIQTIFGTKGQAARCQCQGYRQGWHVRHSDDVPGRRELLRDQVIEGHGLIAHFDGEPAGWCSVAPRPDYEYLRRTVWQGRHEDPDDAGVWAVTCFVTRAGSAAAASATRSPPARSTWRESAARGPSRRIR